jgi:uncharacterized protein YndB with AHSA1/START domain
MKNPPIQVSVFVHKSIKNVWFHLTNGPSIQAWNHASDDWETTKVAIDFKIGGRFCYHMAAKDKSAGFDFEGTFTQIEPFQSFSYMLDDQREVTITLKQTPQGVQVIETFDPENENTRELQQQGWQAILDYFKRFVESR